jgi:HK97 family phage prohead protease
MPVIGYKKTSLADKGAAWDGPAQVKAASVDDLKAICTWYAGDGSKKGDFKLPHHLADGHACVWAGVKAAMGRLNGSLDVPDADRKGIYAHLKKHYSDFDETAPALKSLDDILLEQRAAAEAEWRFCVAPLTHVDVRDTTGNGDDTWTMSGYAAVFNQQTTLYDSKFLIVTESIDPTAFDRVLREQPMGQADGVVHFNFGHDMNRAVAATDVTAGQPGSLALRADAHGLGFLAKVPRDDPDGVAMAVKMRTGVLRQASFAFTVNTANWTTTENDEGPDEDHRRIAEMKHLYDVCATAQGAYPQTVSQLRSYAAAIGHPAELFGGGQPHHPARGGASTISSDVEGGRGDSRARERELEAMRMQIAVAESRTTRRNR